MKPPWLAEIERINQVIRELADSPFKKLLDEMYVSRQILESPDYRIFRENQASIAAEAQKFSDSFTSALSSVVGQYDLVKAATTADISRDIATNLQRTIGEIQPPAMPFIEAITSQLRFASADLVALGHFQATFAGHLLELARDAVKAPMEEREERVENLTRFLGDRVAQSRRGPISLEAYLQILLALVFFLYSTIGIEQLEDRVAESLSEIKDELRASTAIEAEAEWSELRLVSSATASLRSGPSTESEVIGKLTRQSLVRIIDKEKSWALVEYFDFVEGAPREAWIAHRLLQRPSEAYWHDMLSDGPEAANEAARERFESHFGEINAPYATGADNEQIDADLLREYASSHEEN